MRIHPIPFTILLCLFSFFSFSQKDTSSALQLRSGKIFTEKNITQENVKNFTEQLQKINGKSFAVLQFEQIPSESKKQELAASGIQLLDYISGKQEQDQFLNYRLCKRCTPQWQKEYFHRGR